ncbi:hypothetical protein F9L33_00440 [Amylibacter sp. SFDW26]|uniref:hypothetical protein n=1 Tax=Amylibacter sp. SFDW26 TaxID=2652722 RepID=UPI0012625413|nr:hypothetical protein [Amylibacter sp. SFDW26]KAB7615272.1 hypothetical protein F9L33_00440 [Amylibacter sp. SFDW26]
MHRTFEEYKRSETTIPDWPTGLQSKNDQSLFNAVMADLEEIDRLKEAELSEQKAKNVTVNITFQ